MKFRLINIHPIHFPGRYVLGLLLVVICLASVSSASANNLAVPAEFIRDIKMPGFGETILRPTSLHYDGYNDEILVGDSGNNRILIFGGNGVFKFSFSLTEIMTIPRDIATDPEGYIYILGSDNQGPVLYQFDFDGTPLAPIDLPLEFEGSPIGLRNLACDDQGTLYLLDNRGRRILVIGEEGTVSGSISVEQDSEMAARVIEGTAGGEGAYALGSMAIAGDVLYVPVSNEGTIRTYSTAGVYLGSIGHFGSKPGALNFPVAVEVSPEGLIMVLDRSRYCVVCYSSENQFLGEFGGKGISPGWFMGPSLLSVPSADRAVIGQIFRNKIQVCAVPEFIRTAAGQVSKEQADGTPEISAASSSAGQSVVVSQRRSSHISRPFLSNDGEFPSSQLNNAHDAHLGSYPEVSE